MSSINNMELLVQQMHDTIQTAETPLDQKIDRLVQLIGTLSDYANHSTDPVAAEKLEQLATCISDIAENPSQKTRIESVAKTLKSYAEALQPLPLLLPEVMNLIVSRFMQSHEPKEAAALRQTSKETRRQALVANQEPLYSLNIKTAAEAIQFAKEFGPHLTHIAISGIEFTKDEIETLLPLLPNLNVFEAQHCHIDENGAAAIAASHSLKNLKSLDLTENLIKNKGMSAIANSSTFVQLETLIVRGGYNYISSAGFQAIADSQTLRKLKTLDLFDTRPGNAGVIALAQSQTLTSLERLILRDSDIGEPGVRALACSPALANLRELVLHSHDLQDASALLIARSETLPKLQTLFLDSNPGIRAGAFSIACSRKLANLQVFKIRYGGDFGEIAQYIISQRAKLSHLSEEQLEQFSQNIYQLLRATNQEQPLQVLFESALANI